MLLVAGSGSSILAKSVADDLACELLDYETRVFPDGERYVRLLRECKSEHVVVIQSMYGHPDGLFFEYCMLVDAAFGAGASQVTSVFPYFPYLRQDSRFKPGEALSSKIMVNLVESSGTSRVFLIDPHLHRIGTVNELFNIPAFNLSAMPEMANYLLNNFDLYEPIIIAPDEEAEQWASQVANVLKVGYFVAKKVRLGDLSVDISLNYPDVKGRDVVLVDDMISTGGTLARISLDLKKLGARKIFGTVTHGLFVTGSYQRILDAGMSSIITTDTVPNKYSVVSVAPLVARALKEYLS